MSYQNDGNSSYIDLDGLEPLPESVRPMSLMSYILVMWSSAIVIQVLVIGTFLLKNGLNIYQTICVGVLSAFFVAFFAAANGAPGIKYGIPFIIQARSSFGIQGSRLVYIIRIIPALAWYGIGSWIGAISINSIMSTLFGFPDLNFLYFFLLTLLQIAISYKGISSIKWFDASVAIGIFALLGYFLITVIAKGQMDFTHYANIKGSWGALFWTGVSASTANWATVMLNNADLMRHVKPSSHKTNFLGNILGIMPPWITMVFFGILVFVGTGSSHPIDALVQLAPSPFFAILLLVFVICAQISSNLTTSILPAALAFQDLFNLKWSTGVIVSGVISCLTAPWILFTSDWFFWFQNLYSVFLGPILGVMIADFWFVKSQILNVNELYGSRVGGPLRFKGFGIPACSAMFFSAAVAYWQIDYAWLIGTPLSFLIFLIFKKGEQYLGIRKYSNSSKDDLTGRISDKEA